MSNVRALLFPFMLSAAAGAQQTFVVDQWNGPGTHFTDLAPAIAVAVHGDTILVRSGLAYTPGSTDQGITLLTSELASLSTMAQPMVVHDLPAGETFRMAGFHSNRDEPFILQVRDCAGDVYLDDLHGLEHGSFPILQPSFAVTGSAYVHLNDCDNFGYPSLLVRNSTVAITRTYLGITSIGIGGGDCLFAESSTLFITEPLFDGVLASGAAAVLTNCSTLITGSSNSYLQGTYSPATPTVPAAPALEVRGGVLVLDPTVQLNPVRPGPALTASGSAAVFTGVFPGAFAVDARVGGTLETSITAPAGMPVVALMSNATPPVASPFGPLWLDAATAVAFAAGNVPAGGVFTTAIPLPVSLPVGGAFTLQGVALLAGVPVLSTGSVFVLH